MRRPDEVVVLHRDDDFLVVDKPAHLPTTSPDGRGCLSAWVEAHDPRAAYHHPTSRLDAEVTGVVTFARTKRGIEHAKRMRSRGRYERLYVALVTAHPPALDAIVDAPIGVDPKDPRFRVVRAGHDAQAAQSRYVAFGDGPAVLALLPRTGRTHQLRVHAAHVGCPLFGDVHYGGARRIARSDGRVVGAARTMLHCARVAFPSVEGPLLELRAQVPDDFLAAAHALGLEAALSAALAVREPLPV